MVEGQRQLCQVELDVLLCEHDLEYQDGMGQVNTFFIHTYSNIIISILGRENNLLL